MRTAVRWFSVVLAGVLAVADKPGSQTIATRDPHRPVAVFVLDLAANGFQLTSAVRGVSFDIDGIGAPMQVGWTAADADDGFLFLDTNGNGRVDNGRELLGNGLRRPDGMRVASGDEALTVIQGVLQRQPGGVPADLEHIAYIDARDEVFARLRFWRDANHNGVSESGELLTLPQVGILTISLSFLMPPRIPDANGNVTVIEGMFFIADLTNLFVDAGYGLANAPRRMIEVQFARQDR